MWFASSLVCKWGLCANTCHANVFLWRLWLEFVCVAFETRTTIRRGESSSPPRKTPPSLLLLASCLQASRPHLIFLTSRPFFSSIFVVGPLLLLWLCSSGFLAQRRRSDRVSEERERRPVFSHTPPTHLGCWRNTSIRCCCRLACTRTQTSKQRGDSRFFSAFLLLLLWCSGFKDREEWNGQAGSMWDSN